MKLLLVEKTTDLDDPLHPADHFMHLKSLYQQPLFEACNKMLQNPGSPLLSSNMPGTIDGRVSKLQVCALR